MGTPCFLAALLTWSVRRWLVALGVAAGTYLLLGLSSAVVANPVFGRWVPPTDWAGEVLLATAALTGLLTATYVRNTGAAPVRLAEADVSPGTRTARAGTVGTVLAYLAIGCPVCNKLALLLLGTSGAMGVYAPMQPYLGAAGLVLLAIALAIRLRGEVSCATLARPRAAAPGSPRDGSGPAATPLTTQGILAGLAAPAHARARPGEGTPSEGAPREEDPR
jgi:hypothetical protein